MHCPVDNFQDAEVKPLHPGHARFSRLRHDQSAAIQVPFGVLEMAIEGNLLCLTRGQALHFTCICPPENAFRCLVLRAEMVPFLPHSLHVYNLLPVGNAMFLSPATAFSSSRSGVPLAVNGGCQLAVSRTAS
jgi:hypothetical protein